MSLRISLCMFIVSNALLVLKATASVPCGAVGLLNPIVIWWQMLSKAFCFECLCFEAMLMRND